MAVLTLFFLAISGCRRRRNHLRTHTELGAPRGQKRICRWSFDAILSQFNRYKYFRFWRSRRYFRLPVNYAMSANELRTLFRSLCRAKSNPKVCRRNFDDITVTFGHVCIFGLDDYISISGCR